MGNKMNNKKLGMFICLGRAAVALYSEQIGRAIRRRSSLRNYLRLVLSILRFWDLSHGVEVGHVNAGRRMNTWGRFCL